MVRWPRCCAAPASLFCLGALPSQALKHARRRPLDGFDKRGAGGKAWCACAAVANVLPGVARVGELVGALARANVASRAALAERWRQQPSFLQRELAAWLPATAHARLAQRWPAVVAATTQAAAAAAAEREPESQRVAVAAGKKQNGEAAGGKVGAKRPAQRPQRAEEEMDAGPKRRREGSVEDEEEDVGPRGATHLAPSTKKKKHKKHKQGAPALAQPQQGRAGSAGAPSPGGPGHQRHPAGHKTAKKHRAGG